MRTYPPRVHVYRPAWGGKLLTRKWWVWYQWQGKTVRRSLRTEEHGEAVVRARALERNLWAAFRGVALLPEEGRPEAPPVTLGQLWEARQKLLVSVRSTDTHVHEQARRVSLVLEALGGPTRPAQEVQASEVQDYIAQRATERKSPETIRGEVAALRALYQAGVTYGHLPAPPTWKLRLPAKVTRAGRTIPEEDLGKILAGLNPANVTDRTIALLAFTGLRRSDAARVTWQDLNSGWIRLVTGKRDVPVAVPVHPGLSQILKPKGKKGLVAVLNTSSGGVHKRTRALCGTAWGPHDFRRTFLNLLMGAGVDPRVRADLAAHSTEVELSSYNRATEEQLSEAMARLPLRLVFDKPHLKLLKTKDGATDS